MVEQTVPRQPHRGVVARVPPLIAEDAFIMRDVDVEVIDLDVMDLHVCPTVYTNYHSL
jgi:hypothetical protein